MVEIAISFTISFDRQKGFDMEKTMNKRLFSWVSRACRAAGLIAMTALVGAAQADESENPPTEPDTNAQCLTSDDISKIMKGDLDYVKQQVQSVDGRTFRNCRDQLGYMPIHIAITASWPKIVSYLHEAGDPRNKLTDPIGAEDPISACEIATNLVRDVGGYLDSIDSRPADDPHLIKVKEHLVRAKQVGELVCGDDETEDSPAESESPAKSESPVEPDCPKPQVITITKIPSGLAEVEGELWQRVEFEFDTFKGEAEITFECKRAGECTWFMTESDGYEPLTCKILWQGGIETLKSKIFSGADFVAQTSVVQCAVVSDDAFTISLKQTQ